MDVLKTCAGCHKPKAIQCFTVFKLGVREYRHSRCNKCRSEANKLTPARRRNRELVLEAKRKPCVHCGEVKHLVHVELVPLNPVNRSVNQAWRWMNGPQFRKLLDQHATVCEECRRMRVALDIENAKPAPEGPLFLAEFERAARIKSGDPQRS